MKRKTYFIFEEDLNDPNKLNKINKTKPKLKSKFKKQKLIDISPAVNSIEDLINIGTSKKLYKNIDCNMLANILPVLIELNNLIGMDELKSSVFFQVIYYLQKMHTQNQNEEYLHTVIMGSPGTGKTSVARIIGNLYQKLGVLSNKGVFKIAYRDDFVAEYLGQTAVKTRKLLNSCLGGVLFIDEVYSLGQKEKRDSFSKEALDTLTAFLSEHKNDFCCIIAGYQKDIEDCFFNMNKGLKRRFPWCHIIKPYNSTDLTKIMLKMIKDMKWETCFQEKDIVAFFTKHKKYFKYYGGDIETFLTKCKMCHSKRVFSLDNTHKYILNMEDLESSINMIINSKENQEKQKDDQDDDIDKPPPFGLYT